MTVSRRFRDRLGLPLHRTAGYNAGMNSKHPSPSPRGEKIYCGIDKDDFAGMTPNGTVIRDAWVFGILAETETCAGWNTGQFQMLYDKVYQCWQPYGHLVSNLPPDLAERHRRIYDEAIAKARVLGWSADLGDDD
jgi:hypothetical protein